jgi:hypothetical protein
MPRALRPAFVATSVLVLASCTPTRTMNPPGPHTEPVASGEPAKVDAAAEAKPKKFGVHPRDADNRLIFRKSGGTCYVNAPKSTPPPKDLMSGETWTEDKTVACPPEFNDPAFAAIPDGSYWLQDETGACSQQQAFGNPPPPPVTAPCPPVLAKKK